MKIIIMCMVLVSYTMGFPNGTLNETSHTLTPHEFDELQVVNEEPCENNGGMCTLSTDCDSYDELRTDLCPTSGAVCCHSLPKSWSACKALGGECTSGCGKGPVAGNKACGTKMDCCVWVF